MDLIHNSTFRILPEIPSRLSYKAGIYRVILDLPYIDKIACVLIQSEDEPEPRKCGRRKLEKTKRKRRKAPPPLVGELLWMDRSELLEIETDGLIKTLEISPPKRKSIKELSDRDKKKYEKRKSAMAPFMDFKILEESILVHSGIGGLVRQVIAESNVSRAVVYKWFSLLCRHGFDELSLIPRRETCGAPGIPRPVAAGLRNKAGRKTTKQRIAAFCGVILDPEQPGVTEEWAAAIRAADKKIPEPKPSWPERVTKIQLSAFCSKAKEEDGKIILVKPEQGTYPNTGQIRHVLTYGVKRLARLLERTTKKHFNRALRGLRARNWQGVGGPGHTWAIDSTIGDLFLRSSVDRAWILGRPVVYIVVDIWSTAVVGFYVCITGPSWSTAKVAVFNSASDPNLVGKLWGYVPIMSLDPAPTICYQLLCDRGEYLSSGQTETAKLGLLDLTSYTPPYRGDLKGLVEVLHRIEKDAQFLFVPGAMDYRRAELELRKVNPEDAVLTIRDYVQYLYELFTSYNLTADRRHRVDGQMEAAGVFPSPAGLWHWGHAMGIGFRKHISQAKLITGLLPESVARVRRDGLLYGGNYYRPKEFDIADWTGIARNLGGWDVNIRHYPGSLGEIWTPNPNAGDLLNFELTDESRGCPEHTEEEWADVLAHAAMRGADTEHLRTMHLLDTQHRMEVLVDNARKMTQEAVAKASGSSPTMTEVRQMEAAANSPSQSEAEVTQTLQEDAVDNHVKMMKSLMQSFNDQEASHVLD